MYYNTAEGLRPPPTLAYNNPKEERWKVVEGFLQPDKHLDIVPSCEPP